MYAKTPAQLSPRLTGLLRELASDPSLRDDAGRALEWHASRKQPRTAADCLFSGCDAALIQGGAVRGKAEYAKGKFTFGDLMKEFAFECEMAVVQLPGRVLAASFRATRAGEGAKPGFLHADDGARFADDDLAPPAVLGAVLGAVRGEPPLVPARARRGRVGNV